jgi:hypothetical protein
MKSCLAMVGMAFLLLLGTCSYMGWSGYKGLQSFANGRDQFTYHSGESKRAVYNRLSDYFAGTVYERFDGMLADDSRPRVALGKYPYSGFRIAMSTPSRIYMILNVTIEESGDSSSKVMVKIDADTLASTLIGRVSNRDLEAQIADDVEGALQAIDARQVPHHGFQIKRIIGQARK